MDKQETIKKLKKLGWKVHRTSHKAQRTLSEEKVESLNDWLKKQDSYYVSPFDGSIVHWSEAKID